MPPDGIYMTSNATGIREWICYGFLGYVTYGGLSTLNVYIGSNTMYWYYATRDAIYIVKLASELGQESFKTYGHILRGIVNGGINCEVTQGNLDHLEYTFATGGKLKSIK